MSRRQNRSITNFIQHLQKYDQLHDQPTRMFTDHLGKDYIHSSTSQIWNYPSTHDCPKCSDEGIWDNTECCCGCFDCVRDNGWTWGSVIVTDEQLDTAHIIPIPCNGSRLVGADEVPTEYTNLELITRILTDIWDHVPDWETDNPETVPRWARYFDQSPDRTHMIICKELNLWESPETARILPMEPGQPWALQNLLPDPNILDDDEVIEMIAHLEPRQLFQDEEEDSSEKKDLCTEAQQVLDESISNTFNEESYRQLSNILMKLHQM